MSITLLTQMTEGIVASACAAAAAIALGSKTGRWALVPVTAKYFHRHMNDPAARGGPS